MITTTEIKTNGQRPNNQPIYNGPWIAGENCHIIIDGNGFIVADNTNVAQESMKAMGSEQTAPMFGDPTNILDSQSSDLTMLLPIGQNNFTSGIGTLKLEIDPKGYELVNNLQLTPQNTLYNGPLIGTEPISGTAPHDSGQFWTEGYWGGMTANGAAHDYFSIGSNLYHRQSNVWQPLTTRGPVRNIFGYAGLLLACYGDSGGDLFKPDNTSWQVNYLPWRGFRVDGNPFVIYKDGRIYAAFILPPENPVATSEAGADTNYMAWEYAVNYINKLADGTVLNSGLGPAILVDKAASKEIVLTIPGVPWKGGAILRQLWRSKNNLPGSLYLLADENALGALRTQWVDQTVDGSLPATTWNWNTQNNTAMLLLRGGDVAHNMWRSDTEPIFLPEYNGVPNTGDFVWHAETFRDSQGDEALIIGTTSGLFSWDGVSNSTQTLRRMDYDYFNCHSLAVNHGRVYFTSSNRQIVHMWTNQEEAFMNGPWQIQYNFPYDIRLVSSGEYVYVGVCGVTKYGEARQTIYRFNGQIFDWESYIAIPGEGSGLVCPVMGKLYSENKFAWYPNNNATNVNMVTMDPRYSMPQTTNVKFRSALSDCGLPRLRKQVFAVMVRYLLLAPATRQTSLTLPAQPGDTTITVASAASFNVGDWIGIDHVFPNYQEYRKIIAKTATTITLSHPLTNGALLQSHDIGTGVYACATVVTLRNIFTESNPTARDVEIGGPFRSDYLFSYIHLPVPVYTFLDGIEINWMSGVTMELIGWSMLTALNPPYYGLMELNIRVQDQVKLPNNMFSPLSAQDTIDALRIAYNRGAVDVIDQFNNHRKMRVQRLSTDYEEPKQRHSGPYQNQATAHIRLIDQDSELFKQQELVLGIPTSQ